MSCLVVWSCLAEPAPPAEAMADLTRDGAWCWFSDPRAETAYRDGNFDSSVFAPTGSEVQKKLSEQTGWGRPFTPVLELVKHTAPNGVGWIEIKDIIATDWRPKP